MEFSPGSGFWQSWASIARSSSGRKLLSYLIEWRNTPLKRSPDVCYKDCSLIYDLSPRERPKFVEKRCENDICFARVPPQYFTPCRGSCQSPPGEVDWQNIRVVACFQAAKALAKREETIDRSQLRFHRQANSALCALLSHQQRPQGRKKVREDLYKKTLSANGVVGAGHTVLCLERSAWRGGSHSRSTRS